MSNTSRRQSPALDDGMDKKERERLASNKLLLLDVDKFLSTSADEDRVEKRLLELMDRLLGREVRQEAELDVEDDDNVEEEPPVMIRQIAEANEAVLSWHELVEYIRGDSSVGLPTNWHHLLRREVWDQLALFVLLHAGQSKRNYVFLEPTWVRDQAAAGRAMLLVRAFPQLKHLALVDPDRSVRLTGALPGDDHHTAERVNWFFDAFREQQESNWVPRCKLTKFDFQCDCPVNPSSLAGFLDSVSSTLTEFNYGEFGTESPHFTEDLARALCGACSRLRHLKKLCLFFPVSRFVPVAVDGLDSGAALQSFCLVLNDVPNALRPEADEVRDCFQHAIRHVASLPARQKSLRELDFFNNAEFSFGIRHNAASILLQAATSTSLETLTLYGISIRCGKNEALGDASWNESLKSVRLDTCKLGVGTFELLSRFKGITSIDIEACIGLPRAGKCHFLLSKLPCLTSLSIETGGGDNLAVPRDSVLNSIARVGHTFDRLKLTVGGAFDDYYDLSFPSLQTLMLKTAGTLHLSLKSNDSDKFLIAGIKGTTTLQNLNLRHTMAPPAISELFKAVQVNESLRSFGFEVRLPNREAERSLKATCGDSLTDLLRFNKGLRSISLDIKFHGSNPEGYTSILLNAIAKGLYNNQTIEALEWREGFMDFWSLPDDSALRTVLKLQNTVLKRIRRYDNVDYGREGIGYYLWMNRSGRHFVWNANLVTPGLLPQILSAIGKDTGLNGVRYFLRNLPTERLSKILSARGIRRSRPTSFEE